MRQSWEGHAGGEEQREAACALWLTGLLFGDCGLRVGGKKRPAAPSPDREGLCVAPVIAPVVWCRQIPRGSKPGCSWRQHQQAAGMGATP